MKKNKEEKIRIGFWTGAYFWKAELYTNLTKLSMEEKNKISHRGKALRAIKEELK